MKKCQFGMALAYAIAPTTLITVLPVGWIFYTDGSLSAEVFFTTIILSMSIVGPLIAAMGFVDNLAKVGTIVGSVDEILLKPEQDHGTQPAQLGKPDIALDHVSFGYAQDKEILHNISLTIPAGSLTALVGPLRFGQVHHRQAHRRFLGCDRGPHHPGRRGRKAVSLEQLLRPGGLLSLRAITFDDTIRENIRMGRVNAGIKKWDVAKAAGCDGFIRQLEHGYDTRVGGGGGAHLSGGERQCIAIARHAETPCGDLDLFTAYIDPENEAVQRAVANWWRVRRSLSSVHHHRRTISGEGSSIEAQGRHEELLRHCPLYADLWQAHMGVKEGETV